MSKKIFVGIDIGKFNNSINIIDVEGKSFIKKGIEIENNYNGFMKFKEIIDGLSEENEFTYDEWIVGFESTGHYWFNIREYLNSIGIDTVMTKTAAVKHRRALEEGHKGKNDRLDARVIASCVRNGNYVNIRNNEREIRSLQKLTRMRNDRSDDLISLKNKMHRCIDICNPVYFKVFENLNSKTGVALLKQYPSPHDIIRANYTDIMKRLKEITNKPNNSMVKLYIEECEVYCEYCDDVSYAEKMEMTTYIERFLMESKFKNELDEKIKGIAKNIVPLYEEFEKIKGIPLIQLISILSEIGDIKNFKNTRAILAFLGLSLRAESSGNHEGEREINKAGSRIVRKHLFNIVNALIKHNEHFRIAYCYYKSYLHKNPTKKREMQIALMCKFVRVMYGMLKYNSEISYIELLKGYDFSKCNMSVFKEEFEGISKVKRIEKFDSANTIYMIYSA